MALKSNFNSKFILIVNQNSNLEQFMPICRKKIEHLFKIQWFLS